MAGFVAKNRLPEAGPLVHTLEPLPNGETLCPVRALAIYYRRTLDQRSCQGPLFLPLKPGARSSLQLISSWIRCLLIDAYAAQELASQHHNSTAQEETAPIDDVSSSQEGVIPVEVGVVRRRCLSRSLAMVSALRTGPDITSLPLPKGGNPVAPGEDPDVNDDRGSCSGSAGGWPSCQINSVGVDLVRVSDSRLLLLTSPAQHTS